MFSMREKILILCSNTLFLAIVIYRYLSNSSKKAITNRNELKKNYEELVNAMDLVGFTDEVRSGEIINYSHTSVSCR